MSEAQHRLYFLIHTVAHRLRNRADDALLKTAGLTVSQVTALRVIVDAGAISPGQIAAGLGYRKSAMTDMVARLMDAGFITKARSLEDARAVVLRPTAQGKAAITKLVAGFSELDAQVSAAFKPEQIDQMTTDLTRLLHALEQKLGAT